MFIWATDIHLNYFSDEYISNFGKSLGTEYKAEGLIISGDISLGTKLERNLKTLSDAIQIPIYYVLGNHDYWYSSFEEIDSLLDSLSLDSGLIDLNKNSIQINEDTILTGFTGWYDCKFGKIDPEVKMSDWIKIADYKDKDYIKVSQDRSEKYLSFEDKALSFKDKNIKNQIIVTHFPPFEKLIKEKKEAKPFYGSSNAGQTLINVSKHYDKVICLSGHTHNRASYHRKNLSCYVGEACRGKPSLAGIINSNTLEIDLF